MQGEGEHLLQRLRVVPHAQDARGDALTLALAQGHCELPDEMHGLRRARARALCAPPADDRLRDALETLEVGR